MTNITNMTDIQQKLLDYFLDQIDSVLSSNGCNDMPLDLFKGYSGDDLRSLADEYNKWNRIANPNGFEPVEVRNLSHVPDFCWLGFIRHKIRLERELK